LRTPAPVAVERFPPTVTVGGAAAPAVADGPVEVSPADVEMVVGFTPPMGIPVPDFSANSPDKLTPASGASLSDEWLGHLILGYAPFAVPVAPAVELPPERPPTDRQA